MIAHLSFARPLFAAMPRVCGGNLPAHSASKKKLTQLRAGKQGKKKKKEIQGRWRFARTIFVGVSDSEPRPGGNHARPASR